MQVIPNRNYDFIWLNEDGSFGGFLDHEGEPIPAGSGMGDVLLSFPQTLQNKTLGAGTVFSVAPSGLTKAMLGLGLVEDIAPPDMPISDFEQLALNAKADISYVTFRGVYRGVMATEAEMLALSNPVIGDKVQRTDLLGQVLELVALPATDIINWLFYGAGSGGGGGGGASAYVTSGYVNSGYVN